MARTNVQTIKIVGEFDAFQTWKFIGDPKCRPGDLHYTGLLRTARKVGDTERVNHYVLGQLRAAQAPIEVVT